MYIIFGFINTFNHHISLKLPSVVQRNTLTSLPLNNNNLNYLSDGDITYYVGLFSEVVSFVIV